MTTDWRDLMAQYRSAATCLRLLEETGASDRVLAQQVTRCRELRVAINEACPDGEWYDPRADNIVNAPV